MMATSSVDNLQHLPHSVVSFEKVYEGGYFSKKHSHPRHQLIYSITGLMMVNASDITWAVPSGFGLIIPAEEDHETKMVGKVSIQTLYIDAINNTLDGFEECRVVGVSKFLASLIAEICDEERQDREGKKALLLRELILIELATAPNSPLALKFPVDIHLRRVCDVLAANPSNTWTIDNWAFEVGKSRRSFTRSFQTETGLTFREWSQRLRCQLALAKMAQGQPMAKIAIDLGYSSKYSLSAMMEKLLHQ